MESGLWTPVRKLSCAPPARRKLVQFGVSNHHYFSSDPLLAFQDPLKDSMVQDEISCRFSKPPKILKDSCTYVYVYLTFAKKQSACFT